MKIINRVYLIGSGEIGVSSSGDCHIYMLDGGSEVAIVDAGCGDQPEKILQNIEARGIAFGKIRKILLTHAHRDHAAGGFQLKHLLQQRGARISLYASGPEAHLLAVGSFEELGLDVLGFHGRSRQEVFPPYAVDQIIQDGESFSVGDINLKMIVVPGHNPGCACYFIDNLDGNRVLFSGDVIYPGGVIALGNWLGSELKPYQAGLKKLAGLNIDTLLPGHMLWTIRDGQKHIDKANKAFQGLWPPPNISQVP